MRHALAMLLGLGLVTVCVYGALLSLDDSDGTQPDVVAMPYPQAVTPLPVPEVYIGSGPWADPLPVPTVVPELRTCRAVGDADVKPDGGVSPVPPRLVCLSK